MSYTYYLPSLIEVPSMDDEYVQDGNAKLDM